MLSLLFFASSKARIIRRENNKLSVPPKTERFFGENGLNNYVLGKMLEAIEHQSSFPVIINDIPKDISEIEWLETGPCTNLASWNIDNRPHRGKLTSLTIMGGTFEGPGLVGDHDSDWDSPCAEFNFFHDARAAKTAFTVSSLIGIQPLVVPWELCRQIAFTRTELECLKGNSPLSEALRQITLGFFDLYPKGDRSGEEPMYAPADVIAYYAMRDIDGYYFSRTPTRVDILSDPEAPLYGKCIIKPDSQLLISIADIEQGRIDSLKLKILRELGWV